MGHGHWRRRAQLADDDAGHHPAEPDEPDGSMGARWWPQPGLWNPLALDRRRCQLARSRATGHASDRQPVGSPRWLLAHTATGAWTSSDDGQTWMQFNPPILGSGPFVNGPPIIFVESSDLVVVADGTALRVSQNAGRTWTLVTLPTDDSTNAAAALAFSDSRNGMAIVGNQECVKPAPGVPEGSAAVLTTADGGLTWKRQSTLARYTTSLSIAKGLAVITGAAGCGPATQSIAISRDDGRLWASQDLPFSCSAAAVAAPATIWLTCYSDQTVYLASQDGGQTW